MNVRMQPMAEMSSAIHYATAIRSGYSLENPIHKPSHPASAVAFSTGGNSGMTDTDAKIRGMLRRSGWPEPERDAPGLPPARAAAPVDTVGHPAPKKTPQRGISRKPGTLAQVPPYCHAPADASPEEAAVIAARVLGIPQDDTLARWVLLLQFRRAATTKGNRS